MNITQYQTLVFDCDGVVLNSNKVKTESFFNAALSYGEAAAQQLVNYHIERGGISRYEKFEWFLHNIVSKQDGPDLRQLLATYATEVQRGLLNCDIADGLVELREVTSHANWLIVSGGDQQELRDIFMRRGIAHLFNGGIFGSPDSKDTILAREFSVGNVKSPALFLGDSKYDYKASVAAGLDFLFITGWTEVKNWQKFCAASNLKNVERISNLLVTPASE